MASLMKNGGAVAYFADSVNRRVAVCANGVFLYKTPHTTGWKRLEVPIAKDKEQLKKNIRRITSYGFAPFKPKGTSLWYQRRTARGRALLYERGPVFRWTPEDVRDTWREVEAERREF